MSSNLILDVMYVRVEFFETSVNRGSSSQSVAKMSVDFT